MSECIDIDWCAALIQRAHNAQQQRQRQALGLDLTQRLLIIACLPNLMPGSFCCRHTSVHYRKMCTNPAADIPVASKE